MEVKLNRKLVLEEPVAVPDGAGGYDTTWAVKGTVWADLRAGAGREAAGAEVTLSQSTYRITVRAAPVGAPSRPRPEQRFREGTRLFAILAVSDADPGQRYLTCLAREERVI